MTTHLNGEYNETIRNMRYTNVQLKDWWENKTKKKIEKEYKGQ